MPEVQVFHDKLHHVLLLNYVEIWFQLQFSGFSKFSTCTHDNLGKGMKRPPRSAKSDNMCSNKDIKLTKE